MPVDPQESILLRLERHGRRAPRVQLRGAAHDHSTGACGRYDVLGALASGGVGELLRGRDVDLGRDVALKVLRDKHAEDPELVQRLVDEAQIAGQLQHPGIVPVYELGLRADRRPFIAMKLVKGKTLAALLKAPDTRRRNLIQVFEQVCRTVAYAHERGVVHRDLKPSNVMVGAFGEVQVLDWGSARILPRGGVADERREPDDITRIATRRNGSGSGTTAGSVLGTPAYMPPEQALGQLDDLDERSDVFSLGAILCEILTGEPPYTEAQGDLRAQASKASLGDAERRLGACKADRALVDLARACLAPLRADRPAHAGEIADGVVAHMSAVEERAHRGTLASTEAAEAAERARLEAHEQRRARRQTVLLSSVATGVLLLGVLLYTAIEGARRDRAERAGRAVSNALADAERLRGAEDFASARAAAEKAVALAEDADNAHQARAKATLDAVDREAEQAAHLRLQRRREHAFVAALDEIRLAAGDDYGLEREIDERYEQVFRAHGIDVGAPEKALALVQAQWSTIAVELASALDDWSWRRRKIEQHRTHIERLARAIDPDPYRNRLRDAVSADEAGALMALQSEVADHPELSSRTLDLLANALWETGNREAAVSLLQAAWSANPGDFWLNAGLGRRYRALRRWPESVRFYEAAVALRPSSAFAWHGLAHGYAETGRGERAETAFRRAWKLGPATWQHPNCLVRSLCRHKQYERAVEVGNEATRLNPNSASCFYVLATAHAKRGAADDAIAAFDKAIALDPHLSMAYSDRGIAQRKSGDLEGALASQRKSVELDQLSADAYNNLGVTHYWRKEYSEALEAYGHALRLDSERYEYHLNLGQSLSAMGRRDEALAAFRKAEQLHPELPAAIHNNMAVILRSKGDLEGAAKAYRKAIQANPAEPEYHRGLGGTLATSGDVEGGIAALRAGLHVAPDHAPSHNDLGRALILKGDVKGAIAAWRDALQHDPSHVHARVNLANGLRGAGDAEGAAALYRESIRRHPQHADAYHNLGILLLSRSEVEGAYEMFQKALELRPDYAEAHCGLSLALIQKGRFPEAVAAARKGHALGSVQPGWRQPSKRLVAQAERYARLEKELPRVLEGTLVPPGSAELAQYATACLFTGRYVDAATLFARAFEHAPLTVLHQWRFGAACAAVSTGEATWRLRALEWLRAELVRHAAAPATAKPFLETWKRKPLLAAVRNEIDELPQGEREAWRKLWADVDALLERAVAK